MKTMSLKKACVKRVKYTNLRSSHKRGDKQAQICGE